MKKVTPKKLVFLFSCILIILVFFIAGYSKQEITFEKKNIPNLELGTDDLSIWVINDLHYLAESLNNEGEAFHEIAKTVAGKEVYYQQETMEAFIWKLKKNSPEYLIVNGDLTFNGEKESFLELQHYFEEIESFGTQVLVNPGNHDISNGWARSYIDAEQGKTDSIGPKEFVEIFKQQGYDNWLSKDPASLSYVQAVRKDLWIVMVDSNRYLPQTNGKPAPPGGSVKEETVEWLEEVKEMAQLNGAEILPVMHHNLLRHNSFINGEHQIDNAEEIIEIWKELDVKVALTAHLHAQNIQQTAAAPFYEISTGAVAIYPSSIGEIEISADRFAYERTTIPVADWSLAKGYTNESLLNFSTYKKEIFMEDSRKIGKQILHQKNEIKKETVLAVGDFVAEINTDFFSGKNSLPIEGRQESIQQIKQKEAYRWIEKYSSEWLLPYVESIVFEDTIPDTQLIIN
ncbi:metallophosphoesterase [Lacticigenium naphthae]|uniref:metallophosphoesterase n=1 Tax=Lacticigenium naphthae TaxID=515351 RepID=UPI000421EDB2|nr:metallophosphoesterase [Lacticigenium naphthae]